MLQIISSSEWKQTYLLILCRLSKRMPGEPAGWAAAFWSVSDSTQKATQRLGFFFQCDGILEGVLYLSITKGKKVWPLPLRASPLIKHRTERRYDEKGPVSLQHVVVYINITLLDWGFCGNRGNQLELINIVLYWLLHRQLKVAFRWLNNGGRFLKVHWTLISPCPFYI